MVEQSTATLGDGRGEYDGGGADVHETGPEQVTRPPDRLTGTPTVGLRGWR